MVRKLFLTVTQVRRHTGRQRVSENNILDHLILALEIDVGDALKRACESHFEPEAIILARAAEIVKRKIFPENLGFHGTFADTSIPNFLLALVTMISGPCISSIIGKLSSCKSR